MTGDVLGLVLLMFLLANVVLLVRAWAKGQLGPARTPAASPPAPLAAARERVVPDVQEAQTVEVLATSPVAAPATVPAADPAPEGVTVTPAAPDAPEAWPAGDLQGLNPLAGLDDQAARERRIADEQARLERYRRPVTIVRLELHGLDRLVGQLGKDAGDRLLEAMADTLRRLARDADHIAHLGEGAFAVLMPETPEVAAPAFVERVGRASEPWLGSGAVAVSLTMGWAATAGEIGIADAQRLAARRMQPGPWRASGGAASRPVGPSTARAATRQPVTDITWMAIPPRSWETCRDPDCNHKEDHRRERRS